MYTHLSHRDRITIAARLECGMSPSAIADKIGVSRSTIHRELKRNKATPRSYSPDAAQRRAERVRHRASSQPWKLSPDIKRKFVSLMNEHSSVLSAAHDLPVGKSALYNFVWRDACIGSHMKPPRPRKERMAQSPHCKMRHGVGVYGKRNKGAAFGVMKHATPIAARPAIVDAKTRYGDWEIDTMHWSGGRYSLTIRERKSGYVRARLLPKFNAATVADYTIKLLRGLPVKTITSDRGSEFADWRRMEKALNAKHYACDPGKPQQRGGVENANGVVRGMNRGMRGVGLKTALRRTERIINHRPTKRLQYASPAQTLPPC